MTPSTINPGDERRNYFRIDDHVVMSYRPVAPEELPEALQALGQTLKESGTLTTTFADISQRTAFLKKQIRQESPALGDYLDILEDELSMLARALLLRDRGVNEEATLMVNLSAGGIEFHTDELLAPGTTLEMQFIVFPSRHGILTGGRVIRCEPDSEANPTHYKMAVEFAFIRETDRQLIMKHVLGRQSSQLRKQRSAGKDGQEEN